MTQANFDCLIVPAPQHDETLVEARMLDVVSSTKSSRPTAKSTRNDDDDVSMRRYSDYCLKRFMASFAKLGTFLRRRPRAVTQMQADTSHALASALEPLSPRSSSY